MLFKNRKVTVTIDKRDKDEAGEPVDPTAFEKKVEFVVDHLKTMGLALFGGLCVYVLLDTHRQVKIEEAKKG